VLGILAAVVAGALLAVAIAIGLSPFSLFGPVRQVEPGRGIYLDWTVLALGALGLVLVLGGVARHRLPAGAAPRRRPAAARRPRLGVVRAGAGAGLASRAWWACGSRWSRGGAGPPCRSGRC